MEAHQVPLLLLWLPGAACRGEELGLGPEKLRREIQLQARLSHVNIVELKQVGGFIIQGTPLM
jgi:hypothetical protein